MTIHHKPPESYFVVITRSGNPRLWRWEIQRRPKPMGVKLHAGGFTSEFTAKLAGEKALRKLLDGITEERRRTGTLLSERPVTGFETIGEPG